MKSDVKKLLPPNVSLFAFVVATGLILFIPLTLIAAELTAKDIIKKVDQLLRGDSARSVMEMTIINPRWQRTLKMESWEIGRKKTLVRILSPKKEEGVGSLKIDYQMWNYLPRVERVIKIPPSMMMSSWMGSDFTNDDLVKESSIVEDYSHELTGTVDLAGELVYRVEAIPNPEAAVVWGKLIFFVRTADYVPLRQEYFSESGELVRYLDFSEIREMGGRTLPTLWEMVPVDVAGDMPEKKGKKTIVRLIEIEFDLPMDDAIFSLRNLKKWP
ncbi:MAG: outer membrane lipoprotein-sorting protein [bacterium]|nr:outer membrane lipoprotein-sorting protein [bacterium]